MAEVPVRTRTFGEIRRVRLDRRRPRPYQLRDFSRCFPMPTYEYACTSCAHAWEIEQSIREDALKECPSCHAQTAKRQISRGTGFILKGGGWYADLYSSAGNKGGGGNTASDASSTTSTPAASSTSSSDSASASTTSTPSTPSTPSSSTPSST